MITVAKLLESFSKTVTFEKKELLEIIAFKLKKNWQDLLLYPEEMVSDDEHFSIQKMISQKASGMPLARIFGSVDFYSAQIFLDEHVLIPRPETEILLDKVLQMTKGREIKVAFDLCCGSGCLGLAYKKNQKKVKVYLSDISPLALKRARENAKKNMLDVMFVRSDLLLQFPKGAKADLVFCNPPYVSLSEYESLDASVKKYDPKLALVGPENGLGFYKRLAQELPSFLNKGALLALEIGSTQAELIKDFFKEPFWRLLSVEKDYAGKDRFIFLELH